MYELISNWEKVIISLFNFDTLAGGRYFAKKIDVIASNVSIMSLGKE